MPKPINPDAVYTAADLAELLGIELVNARRLLADGEIHCRRPGKSRLTTGAAILDYLNGPAAPRRHTATPAHFQPGSARENEAWRRAGEALATAPPADPLAIEVREALASTRDRHEAVDRLNARNIRTASGRPWTHTALNSYIARHPEVKP